MPFGPMMATRCPASMVKLEVGEHVGLGTGIAKAQPLHGDGRAVQLLALLEADVRVLPRRRPDLLDLDLLDLAPPRGGLPRLGGVRREAAHEFLQVRDLRLGLGVRGLDPLPRLHRGQHEVVVVAGVDLELLVVEVGDVRAHLVQEVAVVADDDHRGVVVVQRPLEPADRVDVEVVGGLVEQQHVGLGEQGLGEQHAQLQPRRHLAHRQVVAPLLDAGVDQDRAGACLGGVAAVLRELALEFGGLHVVGVGRFRVGVDPVALLHRVPHLRVALHHHVQHALVLVGELVLVELAHPHTGLEHDLARAGLEFAAQDLHQRGLAAAVRADQAVAVAVGELDGDVLEERLGFELDGEVGG